MPKPSHKDHSPFFEKYIDLVKDEDLRTAFAGQQEMMERFLHSIPESKADYAYAQGKWTVKQVVQHMSDTERIFSYRALWIARRSEAPLPGFDENKFAETADVSKKSLTDLTDEFIAVRKSNLMLFNSFSEEVLQVSGISNNHPTTVNAIGFMTLGHFLHHVQILNERYFH